MRTITWRDRLAALRQPRVSARLAIALWILWAVVVWNVIFDRVVVVAGRQYLQAAAAAAKAGGPYVRIDDWMRPAVAKGAWMASLASVAILLIGYWAVRVAATRHPRS